MEKTRMDMNCCESRTSAATSRRGLLLGGASFAAWAYLPKFARAADGRDPRLVVIILRGALDGLATIAPVGDPDYAGLHGSIALTSDGPHAAVMLDSFFALHPSMPQFARMYREKQAAVIHAVSTPYRDRSHFDGQDVLESGFAGPGRVQSGWLNRALEALPKGERVMSGLAIGATTPLVLRGVAPTVGWTPAALPQAADDTAARLVELYSHRDPALASALSQGLQLDKAAQGDDMKPKPGTNNAGAMKLVARGAAKLMAADDGPRIAALAFDGWDTHANEGGPVGRLAQLLSGLDGALAEFESGLGERWRDTVVVVATEFGRTARINGTEGTDHGTGTIALLAGGAVKGGRVISDWPGLKPASLYEGRDLAPTTDLRAVLKGVLRDHLGLADRVLAQAVFPDEADARVGGVIFFNLSPLFCGERSDCEAIRVRGEAVRGPDRKMIRIARRLRVDQTDAETVLWNRIRNRQIDGHKFVRQQPISGYICDFVCRERLLIIEVDGGQHSESAADAVRDRHLIDEGFKVLRFWNNDVLGNLEGVLATIQSELAK